MILAVVRFDGMRWDGMSLFLLLLVLLLLFSCGVVDWDVLFLC